MTLVKSLYSTIVSVLSYDLGLPTLFSRAKWLHLPLFLLPVCIARLHSNAGEGAG
jgi:hypothetical protein